MTGFSDAIVIGHVVDKYSYREDRKILTSITMVFFGYMAAFWIFFLRLHYRTELRKTPKNRHSVKTFPE